MLRYRNIISVCNNKLSFSSLMNTLNCSLAIVNVYANHVNLDSNCVQQIRFASEKNSFVMEFNNVQMMKLNVKELQLLVSMAVHYKYLWK